MLGYERRLKARIVNYADDFVICCRGNASAVKAVIGAMMRRLGVEVNEDKTGIRRLRTESVDFLGYTIGRCYSAKTGRAFIGTRPSRRSMRRVREAVSALTARSYTGAEAEVIVERLNRLLVGWSNYFCLGPVSRDYRAVDFHARHRLGQWLRRKRKRQDRGRSWYPDQYL